MDTQDLVAEMIDRLVNMLYADTDTQYIAGFKRCITEMIVAAELEPTLSEAEAALNEILEDTLCTPPTKPNTLVAF